MVHHHAIIIRNARTGKILVEQRPSQGMWANMWQVPTIEAKKELRPREFVRAIGCELKDLTFLRQFRYETTHRSIMFHVFGATSYTRTGNWRSPDRLNDLAMSNAQRRLLQAHPTTR